MRDALDYQPFAPALPRRPARALPWAMVMIASALTVVPAIATLPVLPPLGLVVLLTWRLLARFALRPWAAAPLGLWDDVLSGQPLGSAVLLWSLCFLVIDVIELRLAERSFRLDWLVAASLLAAALVAGRLIAAPFAAELAPVLAVQIAAAVLLFPVAARLVAWVDRSRARSDG